MRKTVNTLGLNFKNSKSDKDFTILYEATVKYYTSIVISAYSIRGADTDDIISKFYIAIFKNINTFNPEMTFYPWMNTILTNECRMFYRIQNKRRSLISYDIDLNKNLVRDMSYEEQDEDLAIVLKKYEDVLDIAAQLTEPYNTVFHERYVNMKKQAEIAKLYNVDIYIIKNVLHIANRQIEHYFKYNRKLMSTPKKGTKLALLANKINEGYE